MVSSIFSYILRFGIEAGWLAAALIVYGRPRLFGLFGKSDDYYIPWEKIRLIGEDAILVDNSVQKTPNKAKKRHKFVTFCHQLFL